MFRFLLSRILYYIITEPDPVRRDEILRLLLILLLGVAPSGPRASVQAELAATHDPERRAELLAEIASQWANECWALQTFVTELIAAADDPLADWRVLSALATGVGAFLPFFPDLTRSMIELLAERATCDVIFRCALSVRNALSDRPSVRLLRQARAILANLARIANRAARTSSHGSKHVWTGTQLYIRRLRVRFAPWPKRVFARAASILASIILAVFAVARLF